MKVTDSSVSTAPITCIIRPLLLSPSAANRAPSSSPHTAPTLFSPGMAALTAAGRTSGGMEETFFKTLEDLIRHYKRKNQGLAMHLRHSVKRKTALLIKPQSLPQSSSERASPREPEVGQDSPFEDHDYENAPSSEYVEVLPDGDLQEVSNT
ncbi:hypothetical protein INR49_012174 [Caranx melampygus]|nr:hypothetical protein INR49_012174 [Caranx melampygus]